MFVDASAIVAILTGEAEAAMLADLLETAPAAITSPIAIFEAALGVCRKRIASVAEAMTDVREFVAESRTTVVTMTGEDAETALAAHARYGKGRGHPAQLNLGDCFAYAVARRRRAALLCKGEDFDRTDIELAGGRR